MNILNIYSDPSSKKLVPSDKTTTTTKDKNIIAKFTLSKNQYSFTFHEIHFLWWLC